MPTVCLLSDTHGTLPEIPSEADFVIHAGDVCPDFYKGVDKNGGGQQRWLDEVFYPYVEKIGKPFYFTWGNHDFLETELVGNPPDNLHLVVDDFVAIEYKHVWFSPWSNRFGRWAWMLDEPQLTEAYENIPKYVDVVVSHGPPHMLGDRIMWDGYWQNVGSKSLSGKLLELEFLKLVVCGHIHEGRGEYRLKEGVPVLNVSIMDEHYEPVNEPVLWDWDELGK